MGNEGIAPKGENLRQAMRWLAAQGPITPRTIDEAAARFDLTPLEEDFLLREFGADSNRK